MKQVSFGQGFVVTAVLALLLLFLVTLVPACAPQATQQEPPQWPPVVEFESASVSGQLELATPAGPVTVDLSTGLVSGEGEVELLSANVEADVAFTVNGARQEVHLVSPGQPSDEGWAQCLDANVKTELIKGLSVEIVARPPGLKEACGPAMLDVQTPLGRWVLGGQVEPVPGPTALEE